MGSCARCLGSVEAHPGGVCPADRHWTWPAGTSPSEVHRQAAAVLAAAAREEVASRIDELDPTGAGRAHLAAAMGARRAGAPVALGVAIVEALAVAMVADASRRGAR